jgi:hypothetical protein
MTSKAGIRKFFTEDEFKEHTIALLWEDENMITDVYRVLRRSNIVEIEYDGEPRSDSTLVGYHVTENPTPLQNVEYLLENMPKDEYNRDSRSRLVRVREHLKQVKKAEPKKTKTVPPKK